ncbi:MAG: glycosyltransferase [Bacteroidales bacterium]|nr:glycosyltransferase [Bacteroidales bacterium]
MYRKAAGYVAQTRYAAELAVEKNWNKKIRVIGNPVRQIPPSSKQVKENIVLSVGRLVRTKHFDDLVRAFVEIGNPDWKLIIVGGDAQKQMVGKELRTLILSLNAEDSVILEGISIGYR